MQSDAIVVLGSGVTTVDGKLTAIGKMRVEKAVACYTSGLARRVICSGKYSFRLSTVPLRTEAQAMKEYAIALGVHPTHIFLEERSRDTFGNAVFSKKVLDSCGWTRILVVTSHFHIARTQYIFKKVLGSSYHFEIVPAYCHLSAEDILAQVENEAVMLQEWKRRLEGVCDGDDAELQKVLEQLPWYATGSK